MDSKKHVWIIVFAILFVTGMTAGYFYFSRKFPSVSEAPKTARDFSEKGIVTAEDLFTLRIYYPLNDRMQMEERKVQRRISQMAAAEAVIGEFLKGPAGAKNSVVPKDARLLGLYKGNDGILYIDMSDEFRRNFGGDVISEFMLLRGLYESLISNVQDISDVKVLIEGKEMESLGGHLYLLYPLKDTVGGSAIKSVS